MSRVWISILIALAPVVLGTWLFGRSFLGQFFFSPFVWLSLLPLSVAATSLRKGYIRMRSGDRVYRDQQPRRFWINIRFMLYAGAALYAMNVATAFSVYFWKA